VKRYAFCPVCGSPLDRPADGAVHVDLLACASCRFEFWQNSKPAVSAIITRIVGGKHHLLLSRRGIEPCKGMWDLPGGFLTNGERPEQGLAREIREELGASVRGQTLLTVEIAEYVREDIAEEARFVLVLFYVCELDPGAVITPMDDVLEARWFPLNELPVEVAFSSDRRAIDAFKKKLNAHSPGSAHTG